jgi:Xaa-Pro aminopeptidase
MSFGLLARLGSRVESLPVLKRWSPPQAPLSKPQLESYRTCQSLARQGALEIKSLLSEGWTERRAAELLDTWLRDHGVEQFFHHSFVWFGDRTRFTDVRGYRDYQSCERVLSANQAVILDVAPIFSDVMCDIGYSFVFGENEEVTKGLAWIADLRGLIPKIFEQCQNGGQVCTKIDQMIVEAGYDNIHSRYPFGVLGHRLHHGGAVGPKQHILNFGWQSYWAFLSRGLFGQLLNEDHEGSIEGLWAIEPHIGGAGWGVKFEEILIVENGKARWIDDCQLIG